MKCGYNGSPITSWSRICPWKEDKRNLLLEKKKQEKANETKGNVEKKLFKKKPYRRKKKNKSEIKENKE